MDKRSHDPSGSGISAASAYIGRIMHSHSEGDLLVERRHIDLCRTACALCRPRHF
jgi:hypothetical protein